MINKRWEYEKSQRMFLAEQFRIANYFTSIMSGNVKKGKIKSPFDLYSLESDKFDKAKPLIITESDIDFMKKQTGLTILNNTN